MHNERDAGVIRREIERQCSIGAGTCSYDGEGLEATGLLTVHADLDIATLERALSDPSAVHLNMLRGGIAKPTPVNIWHLYGDDALIAAMPLPALVQYFATRPPAPEDAGTVERVKAALKPFADYADKIASTRTDDELGKFRHKFGDYRAARAALAALSRLDGEKGA